MNTISAVLIELGTHVTILFTDHLITLTLHQKKNRQIRQIAL